MQDGRRAEPSAISYWGEYTLPCKSIVWVNLNVLLSLTSYLRDGVAWRKYIGNRREKIKQVRFIN